MKLTSQKSENESAHARFFWHVVSRYNASAKAIPHADVGSKSPTRRISYNGCVNVSV